MTKIRTFLKTLFPVLFSFMTLSVFAGEHLVFATHTRAPLSHYLKDVMQEALKPYAITIQVIEMPGSRVISQVNSGFVDGDLSRVINLKSVSDLDTSNYRRVNEPIVLTEIVMITLANKNYASPITWDSINQGKVAFLRGSKTIRKHLKVENRVAVSSNIQVLEMVENERVSSAIMFASVAKNMLSQYPRFNKTLVIQQPSIESFHLFPYLNKKHALLIPKLEHSLRTLKDNGFLEKTANKYQVTATSVLTLSVNNSVQ